jgi:hypothetical protein
MHLKPTEWTPILKAKKWSQNYWFCSLIIQPLGAEYFLSCKVKWDLQKVQVRVNLGFLPSWMGSVYLWSTCVYWDLLSFPMFIYMDTSKESLRTYIPIMLDKPVLGWLVVAWWFISCDVYLSAEAFFLLNRNFIFLCMLVQDLLWFSTADRKPLNSFWVSQSGS